MRRRSRSSVDPWRSCASPLSLFLPCLLFHLLSSSSTAIAQALSDTLWCETWEEEDWTANWHVEGGLWEVGVPTSGPNSAYSGTRCAATILAGAYPDGVSAARLIRHTSFVVPPASENPRLRFWHWFSFNCGDYGVVQIKVGGGSWTNISTSYSNYGSGVWTCPSIDLTAYADSSVQLAFFFHSEDCWPPGWDTDVGWYIDDVKIVTGPLIFNNPEGFENGLGDWAAERGTWQVGTPTSAPDSAYQGQGCAATVLAGNYYEWVDSRLVSPAFVVPPASDNPRLRFWHWFSFNCGDYGVVQIKVGDGSWTNISTSYSNYGSGVWTCPSIDLTAYADSSVQLAFFFHSEDCWPPGWDTDVGWYIDDVKIVTGPLIFNNPEGFENGLGDWAAERGTWQVGTPTSAPDSAYQGQGCAATVLAGNYYEWVDSRLVSPAFVVPPANENPRLRFWHWFSFNCGDYGVVQIKVGTGSWTNISTSYSNYGSGVWTCPSIDLTAYADSTVQLAFFFHSEDCWPPGWDTDVGWYIDEVKFVTGPLTFLDDRDPNGSRFVGFENGLGDWAAERGTWEVGTPTSGPNSCYQGQGCAATVLAGNYYEWVDSRLFSPVLLVEERGGEPALRFWHWYSFNCGDYGEIHIRVDEGPWQVLEGSARFVGPSGAWTPYRVPLVPYRGHVFQLAFFLHSEDCWPPGWDTGAGWYIDEIKLDWVKPVAVQLADFQGRALGDGVELVWELNGEDPIAGIDVYRAEDADSAERVLIEALPEGARRYVDASVTAGRTYRYLLGIRLADGTVTWSRELTVTAGAPAHLAVRHFPNPFNPTVTIEFELPVQARIALTVHDVAGRRVRTLTNGLRPAGRHRVTWDGKDDAGHLGGSGVYFYRLDAGGSILLGRMTLLR